MPAGTSRLMCVRIYKVDQHDLLHTIKLTFNIHPIISHENFEQVPDRGFVIYTLQKSFQKLNQRGRGPWKTFSRPGLFYCSKLNFLQVNAAVYLYPREKHMEAAAFPSSREKKVFVCLGKISP